MAALSEEFLSENDLEAVLNTNRCYEYSGNASEAAEKIATDKKDYQSVPCVLQHCKSITLITAKSY